MQMRPTPIIYRCYDEVVERWKDEMDFSNLYPADPVDPVIRVLFPFHLSTDF